MHGYGASLSEQTSIEAEGRGQIHNDLCKGVVCGRRREGSARDEVIASSPGLAPRARRRGRSHGRERVHAPGGASHRGAEPGATAPRIQRPGPSRMRPSPALRGLGADEVITSPRGFRPGLGDAAVHTAGNASVHPVAPPTAADNVAHPESGHCLWLRLQDRCELINRKPSQTENRAQGT